MSMKKMGVGICLLVSFSLSPAAFPVIVYAQTKSGSSAALDTLEKTLRDSLAENAKLYEENKGLKEKMSALEESNKVVVNLNSILKNESESLRRKQTDFESTVRTSKDLARRLEDMEKQMRQLMRSNDACAKLANTLDAQNTQLKNNPEAVTLRKEIEVLKTKVKSLESERNKALAELSKVLKQKEDLLRDAALMHYNLGTIFFKSREYKKAAEEFRRCFELNPLFAEAYYNLGIIYDDYLGDNAAAIIYYQKYLELIPAAVDRNKVSEKILEAQLKEKAKVDSPLEKQ